ncbi:hypothetical protein KL866_07965 [Alteromonas sp. ALT199]|uniref:hypothetical protein n=1 Tax=unclassified Alteromonas TaxID=2614992 RepID=UPI001BEC780F|nr:hypothetical protein [Alteromonas sp. ALT199]MBT3135038.1 hypothetical protein [Alteromonas sp. ALT199]
MKFIKKDWKSRTAIVVGISVCIGLLMITLEQTQFAQDINAAGYQHGGEGKPDIPAAILFILPFIKALVLIGVPLLIARLLASILRLVSRKGSRKNSGYQQTRS